MNPTDDTGSNQTFREQKIRNCCREGGATVTSGPARRRQQTRRYCMLTVMSLEGKIGKSPTISERVSYSIIRRTQRGARRLPPFCDHKQFHHVDDRPRRACQAVARSLFLVIQAWQDIFRQLYAGPVNPDLRGPLPAIVVNESGPFFCYSEFTLGFYDAVPAAGPSHRARRRRSLSRKDGDDLRPPVLQVVDSPSRPVPLSRAKDDHTTGGIQMRLLSVRGVFSGHRALDYGGKYPLRGI